VWGLSKPETEIFRIGREIKDLLSRIIGTGSASALHGFMWLITRCDRSSSPTQLEQVSYMNQYEKVPLNEILFNIVKYIIIQL